MKPIFEDEKKQLIIDYKQTFEAPAGKRVLEDLKKRSNVLFAPIPFDKENRLDPYLMVYQNGKRSVMIHIYAQLKKDPYEVKQVKAINERENENG